MKTKLFALLLSILPALIASPGTAQTSSPKAFAAKAFADDTWSPGRVAAAVAKSGIHATSPPSAPDDCSITATPPSLPPTGGSVTLFGDCKVGRTPFNYQWSGPGVGGKTTAQVSTSIANTSAFSVTVSNIYGSSAAQITVPVDVALSPPTIANGAVGSAYSQTLTAIGGTGSYTFSVPPGTLPPGLQLSPGGLLAGTPNLPGKYSFTVTVNDTAAGKDARVYDVTILAPIVLSPQALPDATVNTAYSQPVSATGGTGSNYTFTVTKGTLPPDVVLSPGGTLAGIPKATGASAITITATDSAGNKGSRDYVLTVKNATTAVTVTAPSSLPTGTVGTVYPAQQFTASGGTGPYTFTQTGLPQGLALSSSGALTGTPTAAGSFSVVVTATDSTNASGNRTYALAINAAIVVQPASVPSGTVGVAYTQTFSATGGSGSYTFAVQGTLPAGLTFAGNTLSGTPTVAGSSTFTIVATDTNGATGNRPYTLAVSPPPATRISQVSTRTQTGTAGQPLSSPLIVLVTDANGVPVTGAGGQLVATSTVPADVVSPPTEPPGKPGQYAFNVTLGATTAPRTITICLASPPQCVGFVIGTTQQIGQDARQIIGPQAVAAITTPTQQLSNITQHLDNRRLMRNPTVMQGLNVSLNGQALPPMSAFTLAPEKKDGKPAEQTGGGAAADASPFDRWGFFVQGVIDIGKADATSLSPGFDIHTKGLTFGTDYRLDKGVVGAALGVTKADTDLAGSGGNQDTKGWSISFFGEYVPVENAYIDLILNYGQNKYDTTRHGVDATGAQVDFNSNPSGNQFGASLSAGYQFYYQQLTASPYVRAEYVTAKIDSFSESGGAGALEISGQRYSSTVLTLGGLAQYSWSQSWGVLVPYARVELQYAAQTSSDSVTAQYAFIGLSNDPVGVALPGTDKSFGTLSVGATAVLPRGVSGYFNYQYLFGKDNFNDSRFTLGVRVEF